MNWKKAWRNFKADFDENKVWAYPLLFGNVALFLATVYRLWADFQ